MKKLIVIVCNNGLGHTKRVLYLLKLLFSGSIRKWQVNVFLDKRNVRYFPELSFFLEKEKGRINLIHADYGHFEYENMFLNKYRSYLENCDYIWSDNLTFPLKYRKEVFLTGSFLWSDVATARNFVRKEEEALLKSRPIAIGSKYFCTPRLKKLTSFTGVGIYNYLRFGISGKNRYSLLLACGRSKPGKSLFKKNVVYFKDKISRLPLRYRFYLESDYYHLFSDFKNAVKAKFDNKMFCRISAAVIRPGIGSVCDVLIKGGRVFSFYENGNPEMIHNSRVLASLGVGECGRTPLKALTLALRYLDDEKQQRKHILRISCLNFNGLNETADKIQELLN